MTGVVILTALFVLYALVASSLERLSITAPMVFVVAGIPLGRSVTDRLDVSLTSEPVLLVVELTLALLLFADASTVRLREVEGDARLPGRLLLLGPSSPWKPCTWVGPHMTRSWRWRRGPS